MNSVQVIGSTTTMKVLSKRLVEEKLKKEMTSNQKEFVTGGLFGIKKCLGISRRNENQHEKKSRLGFSFKVSQERNPHLPT